MLFEFRLGSLALGLGLLTGVLCFIPYVGAATGFVLALLMSLLTAKGFGMVLGVAIVFGAVQLLDAVLITPRIIGGQLGLSPLWIVIALMAVVSCSVSWGCSWPCQPQPCSRCW